MKFQRTVDGTMTCGQQTVKPRAAQSSFRWTDPGFPAYSRPMLSPAEVGLDLGSGKTTVRHMTSFTVKLPVHLDKRLRAVARRRGERLSTIAWRALEREVAAGGPDFAAVAAAHKGMFCGPSDLSTREGYGR